jgi:Acetyltransferase (GNAT) domain
LTEPNFAVRLMARLDLDIMLDWAAREGWNPGLRDADPFFAADPHGFLSGALDGAPVTAISAVSYGTAFGFLGFYLCVLGERGKGYGLRTWNAALERFRTPVIGLDGVVEQQANYRKSGFVLAHRNIRYGGTPPQSPADPTIRPLAPTDLPEVHAMDRVCFGYARPDFLNAWLSTAGHRAIGCFEGACLKGFAVSRPCRSGTKIGPLFCDSPEVAQRLFEAASAGAGIVFLDVPETNPAACALAERQGLSRVFETARMYRGPAPALPMDRIFGITSFELG